MGKNISFLPSMFLLGGSRLISKQCLPNLDIDNNDICMVGKFPAWIPFLRIHW